MRVAWEDWISQRQAEKAARTATTLIELAERYLELHGQLIPGRTLLMPGVGSPASERVPVRIDTADAIRDTEKWVEATAPLVWGALRMGTWRPRGRQHQVTVRGLRSIAENLPGVYAEDRELGFRISREGGRLSWAVAVVLGVEQPARRIDAACPECGLLALWWKQERGEVRCGNPDCAAVWDLAGESLLRYQIG